MPSQCASEVEVQTTDKQNSADSGFHTSASDCSLPHFRVQCARKHHKHGVLGMPFTASAALLYKIIELRRLVFVLVAPQVESGALQDHPKQAELTRLATALNTVTEVRVEVSEVLGLLATGSPVRVKVT